MLLVCHCSKPHKFSRTVYLLAAVTTGGSWDRQQLWYHLQQLHLKKPNKQYTLRSLIFASSNFRETKKIGFREHLFSRIERFTKFREHKFSRIGK